MKCPRVISGSDLQATMTVRDDDQAAILWRYALRLMGGACRAKVVVWETLLRGDLGIAEGPVKSRLRYVARTERLTLQEDGVTR
ncbi:hypothetical protein BST31_22675 [Mycobacterium marseillense]|jgi:RNA polymerase sigma-70 factor (ECF subfamily)|nr:RNA polymerase sigma factor SigL [Mycobacterium sp. MOTT36Y]KEF95807.1 hypothetical protein K883_04553 [Mycobacterium sp. TKK-01-0059]ORA86689.1 hypothetical protein BST31_22675 [Mycobacterium marseillense]